MTLQRSLPHDTGRSRLTTAVSPRDMPRIATIDDRYQSYNVEMAEVVGGNFWKPYDRQSIARLEAQAKAPDVAALDDRGWTG